MNSTINTGDERDWVWRGWQVRYTFRRSPLVCSANPPVLLVHGFGSSHKQWYRNLDALSQNHSVYALDLIGFGASEKAATSYRVGLWAEQIYEFWRTFIRRPMILVGHSLGALVAATAAVSYPAIASGLVLMTLPATRQERVPQGWVQSVVGTIESLVATPLTIRLIFNIARQRAVLRAALRSAYVKAELVSDELIDAFVLPTGDRGAAQTLCRLTQAATSPDYSLSREVLLSRIQQPTLVLWGEQDRIIPFKQGRDLKEQFPNLTWVEVPEAGHCLYDEAADVMHESLLTWAVEKVISSEATSGTVP